MTVTETTQHNARIPMNRIKKIDQARKKLGSISKSEWTLLAIDDRLEKDLGKRPR